MAEPAYLLIVAKAANDNRLRLKMDEDTPIDVFRMKPCTAFFWEALARSGKLVHGQKQSDLGLWIAQDECSMLNILEALNITSYSTEARENRLDNLYSVIPIARAFFAIVLTTLTTAQRSYEHHCWSISSQPTGHSVRASLCYSNNGFHYLTLWEI